MQHLTYELKFTARCSEVGIEKFTLDIPATSFMEARDGLDIWCEYHGLTPLVIYSMKRH